MKRAIATGLLLLAACSSGSKNDGRIRVAATVAPVVDIVRQVVGEHVELVALIPAGVDSHTFEPTPSTIKALSSADVLFMTGLHLEESTLRQARATMPKPVRESTTPANGSQIVLLGDLTLPQKDWAFDFTFPKEKGDPNPHLWMDPTYVVRWSEIIRDVMVSLNAANADAYRANHDRFAAALGRLDDGIKRAVATIPSADRILLTYHDSFAYFARRYGMRVLGAVQPSDFSEPSPREVQRLIDQVRESGVPAIFGSEVFPSAVLKQVARESGATFVDQLRDDELPGAAGSPSHTYIGMLVENVSIMTRALGGDAASLQDVPTAPTWQ